MLVVVAVARLGHTPTPVSTLVRKRGEEGEIPYLVAAVRKENAQTRRGTA